MPGRRLQPAHFLAYGLRRNRVLGQTVRFVGLHFHPPQGIDGAMAKPGNQQPNLALGLAARGRVLRLVPIQVKWLPDTPQKCAVSSTVSKPFRRCPAFRQHPSGARGARWIGNRFHVSFMPRRQCLDHSGRGAAECSMPECSAVLAPHWFIGIRFESARFTSWRCAGRRRADGADPCRRPLLQGCHQLSISATTGAAVMEAYRYAYQKARGWHASVLTSAWAGLRYSLTGDTGCFRSHGGWRLSRIRKGVESSE